MHYFNNLLMLKSKTTLFVYAVVFFVATSCNKEKKMGETLKGTTWEITSVSINDVQKLGQFYEDSCLPKILKFKSPGSYQSLIFSGFNPSKYAGEIKSDYNIAKVEKRFNKEFYMQLRGFSTIDPNCTCGRFGYIIDPYFIDISSVKFRVKKEREMIISIEYPNEQWIIILNKI